MSTDQLVLILDALKDMGADAQTAFLVWVLAEALSPIVCAAVIVGLLGAVFCKIGRIIQTSLHYHQTARRIAGLLGVSVNSYDWLSCNDCKLLEDAVRRLVERNEAKTHGSGN